MACPLGGGRSIHLSYECTRGATHLCSAAEYSKLTQMGKSARYTLMTDCGESKTNLSGANGKDCGLAEMDVYPVLFQIHGSRSQPT